MLFQCFCKPDVGDFQFRKSLQFIREVPGYPEISFSRELIASAVSGSIQLRAAGGQEK